MLDYTLHTKEAKSGIHTLVPYACKEEDIANEIINLNCLDCLLLEQGLIPHPRLILVSW